MWKWLVVFAAIAGAVGFFAGTRGIDQAHGCAHSITPTTYEGPENRSGYLTALDLAAFNQIAPGVPAYSISPEEKGPRGGRSIVAYPYIPPKLFKAVAFMESHLWNASSATPYRGVGPALVSFDCGHGVAQVTSGMTHPLDSGWPSREQSLVATHYLYNIAKGSNILVSKWNSAPEVRPVVGNGDPRIVESWYYALWSYNGFAFQNHPYLPNPGAWPRTGFSCSSNLSDGFSHSRTGYPYQELVYGCAARPPSVNGQRLWNPQPSTLPNLNNGGKSGLTSVQAWQSCAGSSNCSSMDIALPWIHNRDSTQPRPIGTGALVKGNPRLAVSTNYVVGPSRQVRIWNSGSAMLSFRVKPNHWWVRVNRQAGVSLAPNIPCTTPCDRQPLLTITTASNAPAGALGSVIITNLMTGNSQYVLVRAPGGAQVTPTPSPSPTPSPTPPANPATSPFADSDWDGCINHFESNNPAARGGDRNPNNFWDFFDTPDGNNVRDRRVTAADVYRVWLRMGTSGNPSVPPILAAPPSGYHPAFDRGPVIGDDPWDTGPADGVITGHDVYVVASQAGHSCQID
jgi:hypothetical protein